MGVIIRQEEPTVFTYVIAEGCVKSYFLNEGGLELIINTIFEQSRHQRLCIEVQGMMGSQDSL